MSKHTPGSWAINGLANEFMDIETVDGTPPTLVSRVYRKAINGNELEPVANAHLIAAAPELLEACDHLISVIESDYRIRGGDVPNRYKLTMIKAAIKKARG
jgi:hypothetical protein